MISYTAPRMIGGKINRNALAVAHRVTPHEARSLGWSESRIYSGTVAAGVFRGRDACGGTPSAHPPVRCANSSENHANDTFVARPGDAGKQLRQRLAQ
jgi:hypothetical protein